VEADGFVPLEGNIDDLEEMARGDRSTGVVERGTLREILQEPGRSHSLLVMRLGTRARGNPEVFWEGDWEVGLSRSTCEGGEVTPWRPAGGKGTTSDRSCGGKDGE